MKEKLAHLITYCDENEVQYKTNESLSHWTTFRIGGPVDVLIEPKDEEEIHALTVLVKQLELPLIILGKGSNVLFSAEGLAGVILHLGEKFSTIKLLEGNRIYCQSGASLAALCSFAQKNSLSGLEQLYGIPGSVGGAIYMNAGAYGVEMAQVLVNTFHLLREGTHGSYQGEEMALSYRQSAYSDNHAVITGGTFQLASGDASEILARMNETLNRRRDKQPLDYPSAGSTFKRPEGQFASALIDECGLKGRTVGGAQVSTKHAGFVINLGGATAQDVLDLVKEIQSEVYKKTGIQLEPEVRLMKRDGTFQ